MPSTHRASSHPIALRDNELLAEVTRAAASVRETTHVVALLAELDARRLDLGEGYSSLFTQYTQVLHY